MILPGKFYTTYNRIREFMHVNVDRGFEEYHKDREEYKNQQMTVLQLAEINHVNISGYALSGEKQLNDEQFIEISKYIFQ